jgi:hypothetical protein
MIVTQITQEIHCRNRLEDSFFRMPIEADTWEVASGHASTMRYARRLRYVGELDNLLILYIA